MRETRLEDMLGILKHRRIGVTHSILKISLSPHVECPKEVGQPFSAGSFNFDQSSAMLAAVD